MIAAPLVVAVGTGVGQTVAKWGLQRMPLFRYDAKSRPGASQSGLIEGASADIVTSQLVERGLYVTAIEPAAARRSLRERLRRRVGAADLAATARQLADLLEGGLPVPTAIATLAEEADNPRLGDALRRVGARIDAGHTLSDALEVEHSTFPLLFVSMVRSGESVGGIPAVLEVVAGYLEVEAETRRKTRTAMAYPSILLAVGVVTILVLLIFVLPRLTEMLMETGQALPLTTRALVAVSNGFARGGFLMVPALVLGAIAVRRGLRRPYARHVLDHVAWRLPVLRSLVVDAQLARFGRTMATLLASGLPLLPALEIARQVAGNQRFANAISEVRSGVARGVRLGAILRQIGTFPSSTARMIAVGEDANDLPSAFDRAASSHQRKADQAMRVATSLIEPALVVFVGLVVGFIVFSMMLPIFRLNVTGLGS